MNLFTSPYWLLGSFLGPASILVLIAGLVISWRFGLVGTLLQQVAIVVVSILISTLSPTVNETFGQRLAVGGVSGVAVNFGIVPFNLIGFLGRFLTRNRKQTTEAVSNKPE